MILLMIIFCYALLYMFVARSVSTVTSPIHSNPEVIESPIAPINTKTFEDLKSALEAEAVSARHDWALLRNPFE